MPLLSDNDATWYVTPCSIPWSDAVETNLLKWKKEYYNDWQEFKKLLQIAHRDKYEKEITEIFKEQEAYNRKHYRALTFIIPYFTTLFPGDCKEINQRKWPPDLVNALDFLFYRLAL